MYRSAVQLPGRGTGAQIAEVRPWACVDPLGPRLEDEPLDRVSDGEVLLRKLSAGVLIWLPSLFESISPARGQSR